MISSFILPEYGSLVNAFEATVECVIDLVNSVCRGFVDSILVPLSEIWLGYCQGIAYAMSLTVMIMAVRCDNARNSKTKDGTSAGSG